MEWLTDLITVVIRVYPDHWLSDIARAIITAHPDFARIPVWLYFAIGAVFFYGANKYLEDDL